MQSAHSFGQKDVTFFLWLFHVLFYIFPYLCLPSVSKCQRVTRSHQAWWSPSLVACVSIFAEFACKRRIAPVLPTAPPGSFLLVIPLCLLRVPLSLAVVFCCFVLVLRWFVLFVMRMVGFSAGSFLSLIRSFALPVFMRRTVILHGTTFLRMSHIALIRPSLPSCAAISTPFSTAHCSALAPTLLTPSGRVRWLSPTCSIPCASQTSVGIFIPMLLR